MGAGPDPNRGAQSLPFLIYVHVALNWYPMEAQVGPGQARLCVAFRALHMAGKCRCGRVPTYVLSGGGRAGYYVVGALANYISISS